MIGLTFGGQSSQHRMGEDIPRGLQQPRGFKDSKMDRLQFYGLLQQLLIRWALFHGWHLINVPPVWRCCSGRWRQQEGDGRGSGSADGSGNKKQFSYQKVSLLAFTKSGNTLAVLTVEGCCRMSVVQFLLKEAEVIYDFNQPLSATEGRLGHWQESGTGSTQL